MASLMNKRIYFIFSVLLLVFSTSSAFAAAPRYSLRQRIEQDSEAIEKIESAIAAIRAKYAPGKQLSGSDEIIIKCLIAARKKIIDSLSRSE